MNAQARAAIGQQIDIGELARLLQPAPPAPQPEPPPEVVVPVTRSDAAAAGGTASEALNGRIVREAISACVGLNGDVQGATAETLAALKDIAPTNARESMLAAQLWATHTQAMESFRRAQTSTGAEREWHLGAAARLTKAHATVSEALDRVRSGDGGSRTIVIEHRSAISAAKR
jgi:hypothetical protein